MSRPYQGERVDWGELLAARDVRTLIELALLEDIGGGDATTGAIFDHSRPVQGCIVSRRPTVVCGLPLALVIFQRIDPHLVVTPLAEDGQQVWTGDPILEIRGDVRSILTAERCVLNFLMRLCGIATAAHDAVGRVPGDCRARIYDTRKTTPGWRRLEKAAVRTGGAYNHRFGLYDAMLIKDNHVAAAGSVAAAVERAKQSEEKLVVEVEIDRLDQLDEALAAGPDIILLDNFDLDNMREAVARTAGRVELEASGGITLERIPDVARTGVDRISLGALTHTVVPADLSLEVRPATVLQIENAGEVTSTMEVARQRADAGAPEGTTIVASAQSAGRGRRGRSWYSPPGAGLWLTTILRPEVPPDRLHTLALVAGVAVLEALHRVGATGVRLKWPNDLVVPEGGPGAGGRKLAGILLETTQHAEAPEKGSASYVGIGVGINLRAREALDVPAELADRYIGLDELLPAEQRGAAAAALLAGITESLGARYDEWLLLGFGPAVKAWRRWDALSGREVTVDAASGPVQGIATGVDDGGALLVRTGEDVVRVTSGEVT